MVAKESSAVESQIYILTHTLEEESSESSAGKIGKYLYFKRNGKGLKKNY